MKHIKYPFLSVFLILVASCLPIDFPTDNVEEENSAGKPSESFKKSDGTKLSVFEAMIIDGFTLELQQIYLIDGAGGTMIPILRKSVAELFTSNQQVVNIKDYSIATATKEPVLTGIAKGDKWIFSPMETVTTRQYIESGYAGTYLLRHVDIDSYYNYVKSNSKYNSLAFATSINPNGMTYRDGDDYSFPIYAYQNGEYQKTNLRFEIVTNLVDNNYTNTPSSRKNNAVMYDPTGKYYFVLFDTPGVVNMTQVTTAPLTGTQVAAIVASGTGFEYYLWNGLNTIKIGTNLYIPTIGNTYKYVGTSNDNGMISGYTYHYYRFKFKIL